MYINALQLIKINTNLKCNRITHQNKQKRLILIYKLCK